MKNIKKIASILLIILIMQTFVVYGDELYSNNEEINVIQKLEFTLEEALEYSLNNNLELEIKRLELSKAETNFKDNIRSINRSEDNIEYFPLVDPFTGAVIPDAAINRVLIKNGAVRRSLELSVNAAKWNLEMTVNKVKYDTTKAFYELQHKDEERNIALENLFLSKKQLDLGKVRYDLGQISRQQLIGLEMAHIQAESNLEVTDVLYNIQKMVFLNTIGSAFENEVLLKQSEVDKEPVEYDLTESIKQAMTENGGIRISNENFEISKLTLKATEARYPENTYRYKEKFVEMKKAELNLSQLKNAVEMNVRSSYLNLITSKKQIETFELMVQQATDAQRIAEVSFELGQNTAVEVTQANINLMNAKKSLAQQIHNYNLAVLDFEYSIGIGK